MYVFIYIKIEKKPPTGVQQLFTRDWHVSCSKHCLFLKRALFKTRCIIQRDQCYTYRSLFLLLHFLKQTSLVWCSSNKALFFICSWVQIGRPLLRSLIGRARAELLCVRQQSAAGGLSGSPSLSLILTPEGPRNSPSTAVLRKQYQHWLTPVQYIKMSYQEDVIWPHSTLGSLYGNEHQAATGSFHLRWFFPSPKQEW